MRSLYKELVDGEDVRRIDLSSPLSGLYNLDFLPDYSSIGTVAVPFLRTIILESSFRFLSRAS